MPELEGTAAKVADMLFDRKAVKFGAFRLKLHEKEPDAPLSPIYLNIRAEGHKDGTLLPEDFELIAEYLEELIESNGWEFKFMAGIPLAGEPIAEALFGRLKLAHPDLVLLHFNKEEDASGRRIGNIQEDLWATGDILIVDDLITKADTKLEAIRVCEAAGLEVEAVLVLVDREQGGLEQVEDAGYAIFAGLLLSELLQHYVETGRIDRAKADEVEQYVAASRN